jgi:hypothetical protein
MMIPDFLDGLNHAELVDAAIWLQVDAAYLYRFAGQCRDKNNNWVATQIQNNAGHSAELSRIAVTLAYQ